MTSPLAVVGLTFRGYDPQRPDLDVFFEISEGLDTLPVMRGEDQLVPFVRGRLPGLRLADHRPVVLAGHIAGSGSAPRASYRAYVDELKGIFDPAAGPGVLAAELEDGTMRWINAVSRNIMGGEGFGGEYRSLSIELEALDPYWLGAWGTLSMDAGYELDDLWSLDSSAEVVIVPTSGSHAQDIDTLGTAAVERVRVTFTGPSTSSPGFYCTMPDGSVVGFTFGATLTAGQVLVVDNHARTVSLAGVNRRDLLTLLAGNTHGEYLRLPTGTAHCRVTGAPAECRALFYPTYQ